MGDQQDLRADADPSAQLSAAGWHQVQLRHYATRPSCYYIWWSIWFPSLFKNFLFVSTSYEKPTISYYLIQYLISHCNRALCSFQNQNQNQLKHFRQIFLLLFSSARDSKFEWYQPYPAPERAYPMGFAVRCKIRCPKFLGVNAKEVVNAGTPEKRNRK